MSAAATPDGAAAPAKKGKKKLIIIIAVALRGQRIDERKLRLLGFLKVRRTPQQTRVRTGNRRKA